MTLSPTDLFFLIQTIFKVIERIVQDQTKYLYQRTIFCIISILDLDQVI